MGRKSRMLDHSSENPKGGGIHMDVHINSWSRESREWELGRKQEEGWVQQANGKEFCVGRGAIDTNGQPQETSSLEVVVLGPVLGRKKGWGQPIGWPI